MQVAPEELFAEIGRLTVENKILRTQLAQALETNALLSGGDLPGEPAELAPEEPAAAPVLHAAANGTRFDGDGGDGL